MRLKILGIITCLLCCFCVSCAPPKPLNFEEQQIYDAKQQCARSATAMNPEWPSSDNPLWSSYFVMCMHQFGISNETLKRMWY